MGSRKDTGLQGNDCESISIVIARSVLCDEAIWFSTAPKYEIASSLRSSQRQELVGRKSRRRVRIAHADLFSRIAQSKIHVHYAHPTFCLCCREAYSACFLARHG